MLCTVFRSIDVLVWKTYFQVVHPLLRNIPSKVSSLASGMLEKIYLKKVNEIKYCVREILEINAIKSCCCLTFSVFNNCWIFADTFPCLGTEIGLTYSSARLYVIISHIG